jgi:NH3-dependent NAD+ synthetase
MLYYHAELRDFAVIGTPQKNEHDQGFFVKYGDSAMDVQPIGHLYKTQVYQLADFLNIPRAIRQRPPTSDTYSAASTQEEFFFRLPFALMDLIWYGLVHTTFPPKWWPRNWISPPSRSTASTPTCSANSAPPTTCAHRRWACLMKRRNIHRLRRFFSLCSSVPPLRNSVFLLKMEKDDV